MKNKPPHRKKIPSKNNNTVVNIIASPLGKIALEIKNGALLSLRLFADCKKSAKLHPIAIKIKKQLTRYFNGKNPNFDVLLAPLGTTFQQKVWQALRDIPAGKIMTYRDLAKKLKTSARAVGNACRINPIPIIVPCHRVIAKNGLGG